MTRDIGEPSLEEILASIKKVIAEDGRKPRRVPPARPVSTPVPPRQEKLADDILELDESVESLESADDEPALVSHAGQQSMRESLAVLATLTEPGVSPQIVRSGETSLEGMVRDMLRPMLAEWLDRNLPPIVESMVAKEIGRITGRKG